ncbi:glucose-6-phosphate isomerase [Paraburkholderia sp. GV068]|jgi:glucose-6-phosphate isomerase|uniref:Glucose-6-phosphate isomerase n=1 Tax=Paraburkholderia graminis (strain ATCC 700544 / DSM 17151 / LMG 18924 / NCIMB 13744 / C4D1M) TaxID=396598 RepID=B1FZ59_PARG4|nr:MULTISPECIES: glucose-6-phosphate isomerase [Paraburkholderia]EDT11013.1 Glucose-6-phosphate isomerase [Paraburkholderia graminis C4D1M]PTR00482.1 glucose-6-phosphate isomerase [Paraburkholderia sp. GV072]PUB05330.1 glucose-6-phosphate isomerase [Paraburkholderia sp. GV068]CAB3639462.1 Glucose-6-phosphate isomerase [Paraburkholderia graminis C4D1M]
MTQNSLPSWSSLQTHYEQIRNAHLRDWFAPENDPAPTRAERFAFAGGGLAADFSKNRITDDTLKLLVQLAREAGVEKRRDAMFAGEVVNPTEGRAALHTALRASSPSAPFHAQVQAERAKMAAFADQVRSGAWTGYTGKRIRHVVNIGIGGSDLGPKMVVHALHHLATPEIAMHFVSNVDGADLYNVMQQIDPEETLAIIVSKTFTTLETMTNARSLRDWFIEKGCPENALAKHFVGVSANPSEVVKFGIAQENVFEMWDWVGGRYSLWSAVGLSIMIAVGPQQFGELLAGANEMDEHFRTAPLDKNLPVLLGMIGIWYRNFFGSQSYLVAPYSEALHYLPSYLQQLEMESNGKSARLDGAMVDYPTSAVTWGEPGTNGQHAFFQMLHQGPTIVPIDFVAVLTPEHPLVNHHAKLLANCFAQSEALMLGRTLEEAKKVAGPDKPELAPHLVFPGNRPTSTLILDALTARSLGALIALYEHKVLVQASVWNINPFDQWGVELGKILGKVVEADLTAASVDEKKHDSSTSALIARARAALKR